MCAVQVSMHSQCLGMAADDVAALRKWWVRNALTPLVARLHWRRQNILMDLSHPTIWVA